MAFIVKLTKDDYEMIIDELDVANEQADKLFKKKGQRNKEAYEYWSGRVTGLRRALHYIEEAYARDRRE